MATEVILPKIGFSMSEGTLAEWLVKDGGQVTAGRPLRRQRTSSDRGSTFEAHGTGRGLSVDDSLHCLGVAGALHRDGSRGGLDLGQVSGGEFKLGGAEIFLEPGELAGAGDRDDPRLLGEQPGQRDLGRGGAEALGDPREQVDHRLVRRAGVGGEPAECRCGSRPLRTWSWCRSCR